MIGNFGTDLLNSVLSMTRWAGMALVLMIGTAVFFTGLAAAQQKEAGTPAAPVESGSGTGGEDIGTVLNTLNEALGENQTLKGELETARGEMKKVVLEGNALRSQVKAFEKDKARAEKQWEERVTKLTDELRSRQKEIQEMKDKIQDAELRSKVLEEEKKTLSEERKKLNELMEKGMVEGEREEYDKLLSEAQSASDSSLEKIRAIDTERERLREESANLNFQLGTVAFDNRDFESAVLYFQKTLELRPSDANANHNLGIIFDYYVPDPDRAIYHYRRYLNLIPLEENANEIRERILALRIGKSVVPPAEPLKRDFFKNPHYTN